MAGFIGILPAKARAEKRFHAQIWFPRETVEHEAGAWIRT
jgi:hypothetical protein